MSNSVQKILSSSFEIADYGANFAQLAFVANAVLAPQSKYYLPSKLICGVSAYQALRATQRLFAGDSDYYHSRHCVDDTLFIAGTLIQTAIISGYYSQAAPMLEFGIWAAGFGIDVLSAANELSRDDCNKKTFLNFALQGAVTFLFRPSFPFQLHYAPRPILATTNGFQSLDILPFELSFRVINARVPPGSPNYFGDFLKSKRAELSLSLAEAARRAGVSKNSWYFAETGRQLPREHNLPKFAQVLDVQTDALINLYQRTTGQVPPTAFGKEIKRLRINKGWSMIEAAKRSKLSLPTWKKLEDSVDNFRPSTFRLVAEGLDVPCLQLTRLVPEANFEDGAKMSEIPTRLGQTIKYFRGRVRGLTIVEAAEKADMPHSTWDHIELGCVHPSQASLDKICQTLKVSYVELVKQCRLPQFIDE